MIFPLIQFGSGPGLRYVFPRASVKDAVDDVVGKAKHFLYLERAHAFAVKLLNLGGESVRQLCASTLLASNNLFWVLIRPVIFTFFQSVVWRVANGEHSTLLGMSNIFFSGDVFKIIQSVVRPVVIQVVDNHAFGSNANKCFHNQMVNGAGLAGSSGISEADFAVSTTSEPVLEDRVFARAMEGGGRSNSSEGACLIPTLRAWNISPFLGFGHSSILTQKTVFMGVIGR